MVDLISSLAIIGSNVELILYEMISLSSLNCWGVANTYSCPESMSIQWHGKIKRNKEWYKLKSENIFFRLTCCERRNHKDITY